MIGEGILYTKLNPPEPQRYTWARPRVTALLREVLDYRVTIVQAGTGYGKSTALAQLAQEAIPLYWYSASEADADPHQFLLHVIAAFRVRLPRLPETPRAYLQEGNTQAALDALLNALQELCDVPALLVIDDYYLAASTEVNALTEHFLTYLPSHLHVIVSTRYPPAWENLLAWRASGRALDIRRDALAFTRDEIATLFRETYQLELSPEDVGLLSERTEGWPIALQLVWHEMRARPDTQVEALLARGSDSLDTLFAYLAMGVLAQQSPSVQDFLLQTAALQEFDAAACDAVRARDDSRELLGEVRDRDLFVIALGGEHYRYHHLFHDFLRERAARQDTAALAERHARAAAFYRQKRDFDEAIYHLLQAGAHEQAAALVKEIGEQFLRMGRLDTVAAWIDALPPETIEKHPLLMFFLGDLARLRSRFDDAVGWYAQTERAGREMNDLASIARALRGQALVYLDTLRPAQAEKLLQQALRLNDRLDDRAAKARLLELLAENKLNSGRAEEAERLRAQARALKEEGPSEDVLSVRVKLRTGRLDEARQALESLSRAEKGQLHPPRGHRETLLIQSLIAAMQGQADEALSAAQEGIALGAQLHSPFITAVGRMRLGHALQIRGGRQEAMRCYEEAVALGDQLAVQRIRAEACWGKTRAHGVAGDLESARRDADEGIRIARDTGDVWLTALVQIALGASLVLARREREANSVLDDALAGFRSSGDAFGRAAARLWLALASWRLNLRERALTHLEDALSIAQAQHYDYLFTTRTLLGFQDARVIVPLLLETRRRGRRIAYITHLLAAMGLEQVTVHPGYQLRVQTLGTFAVWRGEAEVADQEWQRRKARHLFQVLITRRGKMLQREEIFELIWGKETLDAAGRDFRVTLNALNRALEPVRSSDAVPAFVVREGHLTPIRNWFGWNFTFCQPEVAKSEIPPEPISIAAYFRERFPPEALDYYAEPVLAGIHAGDVERLSMNALFPELMTGASARREPDPQGEFRSFPRGMQELVDALVSALPREALHVSTAAPPIDDLLRGGPVIVATPAHAAARLFEPIDAELSSLCRDIRYVSSGIVVLAYPRAAVHHSLQGSGFVVPRAERTFRILAATWLSSKWPGRAPDDVALMRAFFGGARDPRAMDLPDDGAIAMAHEDLSRLLAIDVSPSFARVYRWPDGTPQYEVDYPARLQAIRSRLAGHARLFVTGAGFGQIGIPDCIADARAIAAGAAEQ